MGSKLNGKGRRRRKDKSGEVFGVQMTSSVLTQHGIVLNIWISAQFIYKYLLVGGDHDLAY